MRSSSPFFSHRRFGRAAAVAEGSARLPAGVASAAGSMGDHLVNPRAGAGSPRLLKDSRADRLMMTMDDVVVRAAATPGTVVLTATPSWVLLPVHDADIGRSCGPAVAAGAIASALSVVQALRRSGTHRHHFKQVEDAVVYGAPCEESWPAAFGLTTTLVWIHGEALRVLTLLRDDT